MNRSSVEDLVVAAREAAGEVGGMAPDLVAGDSVEVRAEVAKAAAEVDEMAAAAMAAGKGLVDWAEALAEAMEE
jgi:hypothetical protein